MCFFYKRLLFMYMQRGCTPLHLACRRAQTSIATALLEAGCALDVLDQVNKIIYTCTRTFELHK